MEPVATPGLYWLAVVDTGLEGGRVVAPEVRCGQADNTPGREDPAIIANQLVGELGAELSLGLQTSAVSVRQLGPLSKPGACCGVKGVVCAGLGTPYLQSHCALMNEDSTAQSTGLQRLINAHLTLFDPSSSFLLYYRVCASDCYPYSVK